MLLPTVPTGGTSPSVRPSGSLWVRTRRKLSPGYISEKKNCPSVQYANERGKNLLRTLRPPKNNEPLGRDVFRPQVPAPEMFRFLPVVLFFIRVPKGCKNFYVGLDAGTIQVLRFDDCKCVGISLKLTFVM